MNTKTFPIFMSLILIDLKLRLFGFHKIFPPFIKKYKLYEDDQPITEELAEKLNDLLNSIDLTCSSYPFDAKCLHRSFLGYQFIRKKYQVPIELVIGVKKFPFTSHAWLTYKGMNVNEDPKYTNEFSVILTSEKHAN